MLFRSLEEGDIVKWKKYTRSVYVFIYFWSVFTEYGVYICN